MINVKPNQEVLISCTRCTVKVPIGQTVYEKNGQDVICFECYNKIASGVEPEVYRTIQSAEGPRRINYKCDYCGFRFSRLETFQFGGRCFNCGKEHVGAEEQKTFFTKDRKTLLDY